VWPRPSNLVLRFVTAAISFTLILAAALYSPVFSGPHPPGCISAVDVSGASPQDRHNMSATPALQSEVQRMPKDFSCFEALSEGLSRRILARLLDAESEELNPDYRTDYRLARVTVAYAASGEYELCGPYVAASYMLLGLHPDKVWPEIVARRKAQLAGDYSIWYDEADNLRLGMGPAFVCGASPKKPVHSESSPKYRAAGAAA